MKWFRMYSEALHDPKVQLLAPDLFKHWFNLLCLTCTNGGILPDMKSIAFALRVGHSEAAQIVSDLGALIDHGEDGTIRPHNWDGRQFQSDNATDRSRRLRKRQETVAATAMQRPGNGNATLQQRPMQQHCNGDATASDTDTDTDTENRNSTLTTKNAQDDLIAEIATDMRAGHRKTSGLGGLELERALTEAAAGAVDESAVLRAIHRRWRLAADHEWHDRASTYWPHLVRWIRDRQYLDPDPQVTTRAVMSAEERHRASEQEEQYRCYACGDIDHRRCKCPPEARAAGLAAVQREVAAKRGPPAKNT